jgi:hypothetical protein
LSLVETHSSADEVGWGLPQLTQRACTWPGLVASISRIRGNAKLLRGNTKRNLLPTGCFKALTVEVRAQAMRVRVFNPSPGPRRPIRVVYKLRVDAEQEVSYSRATWLRADQYQRQKNSRTLVKRTLFWNKTMRVDFQHQSAAGRPTATLPIFAKAGSSRNHSPMSPMCA